MELENSNFNDKTKLRQIIMSVKAAQDKKISFKAKGILAYMKTRQGKWKYYEKEIMQHATDGRDSVRSGIKELIDAGYIVRERYRDEAGKLTGYTYYVSDYPEDLDEIREELNQSGKSDIGKTDIGKPAPIINSLNKQELKDKGIKDIVPQAEQVGFDLTVPEPVDNKAQLISDVIHHLNVKADKSFSADTKETVKFIGARSKQGATLETFKHVIDVKCLEWLGTDQEMYLRPKTLFSESNFEVYKQQTIEQVMAKKAKANGNTPKQPSFLQNKLMGGANVDRTRIDVTPGYGGNNPRAIGTGSTHT